MASVMVTELVIPADKSSSFREGLLPLTLGKSVLYQTHRLSLDPDQICCSHQIDRRGLNHFLCHSRGRCGEKK